jgi:hypothetical protein
MSNSTPMVTKFKKDGNDFYHYKGTIISKSHWDNAGCQMYCGRISEDKMIMLLLELHNTATIYFGEEQYNNYLQDKIEDNFVAAKMNDTLCKLEEKMFIKYGGKYYKDMSDEEYVKIKATPNIKEQISFLFTDDDYAEMLYDRIIDDVVDDIISCADVDNFNGSDIALAIQRVLLRKLGEAI